MDKLTAVGYGTWGLARRQRRDEAVIDGRGLEEDAMKSFWLVAPCEEANRSRASEGHDNNNDNNDNKLVSP